MNKEKLMEILPHRDSMLLLDDAENIDGTAIGHYTVKGDEFFLKGHFPKNPIVPGVILCEILAQTSCVLLGEEIPEGTTPVYTGLDKVRFRSPVRPGDTIETKCRIERVKKPFYFAKGEAFVNGNMCVSAEFSFAVVGA